MFVNKNKSSKPKSVKPLCVTLQLKPKFQVSTYNPTKCSTATATSCAVAAWTVHWKWSPPVAPTTTISQCKRAQLCHATMSVTRASVGSWCPRRVSSAITSIQLVPICRFRPFSTGAKNRLLVNCWWSWRVVWRIIQSMKSIDFHIYCCWHLTPAYQENAYQHRYEIGKRFKDFWFEYECQAMGGTALRAGVGCVENYPNGTVSTYKPGDKWVSPTPVIFKLWKLEN